MLRYFKNTEIKKSVHKENETTVTLSSVYTNSDNQPVISTE